MLLLTDTMLVERLRRGDESAYVEIVNEYEARLHAVARRLLASEQDARDAVQDAFLMAYRGIGQFSGQSKLGTWLHRIVVNAALMKRRAAQARSSVALEWLLPKFDESGHHVTRVDAWSDPAQHMERGELQRLVRNCIDALPETHRTVLMLRDIQELTTEDTAEQLGISQAAVKVRLHRARQALRTLLAPALE